jgi:NAD(P)-dependent dehydrogenase (short-subunit alcohol dehydrogenase family)|uniref:SDR family NAD(P)-dependent oxidoreductase n=1 Tax=Limnohabitans sp. TaxID=1907725 RepID=UPI004048DEAD
MNDREPVSTGGTPVALVTGAAGGIGKAICESLRECGYLVIGADIQATRGAGSRRLIELDVTSPESWKAIRSSIQKSNGRLDLLVNNAGLLQLGDIDETSLAQWTAAFQVNVTGAFLGIKAMRDMLIDKRGVVINMSSVVALRGQGGMVAYAASKAGLLGLTYAAACEFAPYGVRVNAVCPGTIDTAMATGFFGAGPNADLMRSTSIKKHPIGRLGLAHEVAAAVIFLASPNAGFITGVALPVDGGRTLG